MGLLARFDQSNFPGFPEVDPAARGRIEEITVSLATGMRLGPYEIVAPIAWVAWTEVYKARDTRLDRIVAIKVSRFSERFEREARTVAASNHANICRVGPDPHLNQ